MLCEEYSVYLDWRYLLVLERWCNNIEICLITKQIQEQKIIEHAEKLIKKQELLKFEINKRGSLISALMPSILVRVSNGDL